MVSLKAKIKHFLLGTSTVFCLAIFSPIDLAMSRSNEQVIASTISDLPNPISVLIGVSLLGVTVHLILALGATGIGFWKIIQHEPSLEVVRIAMIVSAVGVAISLISFQLNSPLLNSIALVATVFNSATLLASYLATSTSKE